MNKSEIRDRLAGGLGSKVEAKDAIEGVFEAVGEALANGKEVRVPGFGTYATKSGTAHSGRNRQNGEVLSISPPKTPPFKAGKALRDAINTVEAVRAELPLIGGTKRHRQPGCRNRAPAPRRRASTSGPIGVARNRGGSMSWRPDECLTKDQTVNEAETPAARCYIKIPDTNTVSKPSPGCVIDAMHQLVLLCPNRQWQGPLATPLTVSELE